MNMSKNFEKIKSIEFSQAIKIDNKELYLAYKVTINSINSDKIDKNTPNTSLLNKNSIINGEYEPIAYLYLENENKIHINSLSENYTNYLEKNENKEMILKKFKDYKSNK